MGLGALTAQMTVALGCRALDDLLGGGVEEGCITLLHGEAGSGKTNFCLQLARNVVRAGRKVIYIDTEGVSLERLRQICGDDFEVVAKNILFSEPYSFEEQENLIEKEGRARRSGSRARDSRISGSEPAARPRGPRVRSGLPHPSPRDGPMLSGPPPDWTRSAVPSPGARTAAAGPAPSTRPSSWSGGRGRKNAGIPRGPSAGFVRARGRTAASASPDGYLLPRSPQPSTRRRPSLAGRLGPGT